MRLVPLNQVELASLHIMPKGREAMLYTWGGMIVQSYLLDRKVGHFRSANWNFWLLPSFSNSATPKTFIYIEFHSYPNLFRLLARFLGVSDHYASLRTNSEVLRSNLGSAVRYFSSGELFYSMYGLSMLFGDLYHCSTLCFLQRRSILLTTGPGRLSKCVYVTWSIELKQPWYSTGITN